MFFFLLYGGSQTYKCITATYLSKWTIDTIYNLLINLPIHIQTLVPAQCCQFSNFVAKFRNFSDYSSNFFFQKHLATNLAFFLLLGNF